jgi:hypothetical protein
MESSVVTLFYISLSWLDFCCNLNSGLVEADAKNRGSLSLVLLKKIARHGYPEK